MKYFLNHDWQSNMLTPNKKIGEKEKIKFLIVFSFIYLIIGLFNHAPWRPLETESISIFSNIFYNNHILSPVLASSDDFSHPHIYEIVGAIFAKVLPFLEPHNAARLSNVIWILFTMVGIGLTSRELKGIGYGRQSNIIFLSSVGLVLTIHSFTHYLAIMSGFALCIYAFSLSNRRPFRASLVLGFALALGILSKGLLFYMPVLLSCCTLALFPAWNTKRLFIFFLIGSIISLTVFIFWLYLLSIFNASIIPKILSITFTPSLVNFKYYLINILWFAWPAIPLFLWTLFSEGRKFHIYKRINLPLIFILWFLGMFISESSISQINLIIILPAIAIVSSSSVDTMQRGASGALNWFGILIFSFIASFIWIGWTAHTIGFPERLYERMIYLSGNIPPNFNLYSFLISVIITILWIYLIIKNKYTNRSSVSNWALGICLNWILLILLWLPMIENRKDYGKIFSQINKLDLPKNACFISDGLSGSHINLFYYYTLKKVYLDNNNCKYVLGYRNLTKFSLNDSEVIWEGQMPIDRKKFFIIKDN